MFPASSDVFDVFIDCEERSLPFSLSRLEGRQCLFSVFVLSSPSAFLDDLIDHEDGSKTTCSPNHLERTCNHTTFVFVFSVFSTKLAFELHI
jgi:hypothetical protein